MLHSKDIGPHLRRHFDELAYVARLFLPDAVCARSAGSLPLRASVQQRTRNRGCRPRSGILIIQAAAMGCKPEMEQRHGRIGLFDVGLCLREGNGMF